MSDEVVTIRSADMPDWDMCAYHMVPEPITAETFKVCGECGHAWQSEQDLDTDFAACAAGLESGRLKGWGGDAPWTVDVLKRTGACPLCAHDF